MSEKTAQNQYAAKCVARIKLLRRLLILCFILIVVLLILKIATLYMAGPRLVNIIRSVASEYLDGELTLDDARIEVTRGMTLGALKISPKGHDEPVVEVSEVICNIKPLLLLAGKLVPSSLNLRNPRVHLEIDKAGNINLAKLLKPTPDAEPVHDNELLADGISVSNMTVDFRASPLYANGKLRTLKGLNVFMKPTSPALERWSFEADFTESILKGTKVRGFFDMSKSPADYSVEINIPDVRAGKKLLELIPVAGDKMVEMLDSKGRISATIVLQPNPAKPSELSYCVTCRLKDLDVSLKKYRQALEHINGLLTIQDGVIQLDDFKTDLAPEGKKSVRVSSGVSVGGSYDLKQELGLFHVAGDSVYISESLVKSIGPEGEKVWRNLRPEGLVSFRGRIMIDRQKGKSFSTIMTIKCDDMNIEVEGLKVRGIQASAMIDADKIRARDISAECCFGVLQGGSFRITRQSKLGPLYSGRIELQNLDLAEMMRQMFPSQKPRAGSLSGKLQFGGAFKNPEAIVVEGKLLLEKGQLYKMPVLTSVYTLLNLKLPAAEDYVRRIEAKFFMAGTKITFEEIIVDSENLQITGKGWVKHDGSIDMLLITATQPRKGKIPILSKAIKTVLGGIEKHLTKLRITGNIDKPETEALALRPLTHPIESLFELLPEKR